MPVKASGTTLPREAELYGPVKVLLEHQGYVVKGEIVGCDVVGVREDEPPVVVELKRQFGLALVLQGIDRLALTDAVYLAVGAWPRRVADVVKLCRRVGLGLIVVARGRAEVVLDPVPYAPRKNRGRVRRLLSEHHRRLGDPTVGGSVRRPIMTAYRQESLRCAGLLEAGPAAIRDIRRNGDVPRAGRILQANVHGWFERIDRGVYALTARGQVALAEARAGASDGALAGPLPAPSPEAPRSRRARWPLADRGFEERYQLRHEAAGGNRHKQDDEWRRRGGEQDQG